MSHINGIVIRIVYRPKYHTIHLVSYAFKGIQPNCLINHNHFQHYWYYLPVHFFPSAFLIRKVNLTLFRLSVAGQGPVTITANVSTERDNAGATESATTLTLHKQHLRCSPRVALIEATVLSLNHLIMIRMSGACVHASLKHLMNASSFTNSCSTIPKEINHESSCTPIRIRYMWFSDILNSLRPTEAYMRNETNHHWFK